MTPESDNQILLTQFYQAFARRDYQTMAECYHDQATFQDPVFSLRSKAAIAAMWEMLCRSGKDLKVTFREVQASQTTGSANWEAAYTFSKTGKRVHNVVKARFELEQGKIIRHVDEFDFPRWAAMAFGTAGKWLGGYPFFQRYIQSSANARLRKFLQRKAEK